MLRLLFASLTLCLLFTSQTNAQIIDNTTPCWYEVKANVIPVGTCMFTGAGPLYGVPGGTVITVPKGPTEWVVGYGVRRPPRGPVVVGEPTCGYPASRFVGGCMGLPTFATYAGENVTIHF